MQWIGPKPQREMGVLDGLKIQTFDVGVGVVTGQKRRWAADHGVIPPFLPCVDPLNGSYILDTTPQSQPRQPLHSVGFKPGRRFCPVTTATPTGSPKPANGGPAPTSTPRSAWPSRHNPKISEQQRMGQPAALSTSSSFEAEQQTSPSLPRCKPANRQPTVSPPLFKSPPGSGSTPAGGGPTQAKTPQPAGE